jgi:hypothetical protein
MVVFRLAIKPASGIGAHAFDLAPCMMEVQCCGKWLIDLDESTIYLAYRIRECLKSSTRERTILVRESIDDNRREVEAKGDAQEQHRNGEEEAAQGDQAFGEGIVFGRIRLLAHRHDCNGRDAGRQTDQIPRF